jgi:hypothetical protein
VSVGLLLGAGASFEMGMPLACHITKEITRWLTPAKLRTLNDGWCAQGGGINDRAVNDLCNKIEERCVQYEEMLGYLETQFRRHETREVVQDYYHLYLWLVELIYILLYQRHVRSRVYIRGGVPRFSGLAGFAKNGPLWVFSLNHDLMVEIIAAEHGIELATGFTSEPISLPRRDQNGAVIGRINGATWREQDLLTHLPPFPLNQRPAINLFKLHGSLDVFAALLLKV